MDATQTQESDMDIDEITEAIAEAIHGHDGFTARAGDEEVTILRGRRPMGTIALRDDDGIVSIDTLPTGCQGAINGLLRAAGVCDAHWDITQ